MAKGTIPNLLRVTFIVCVFFGLLNAFINHPVEDAVAGFLLGVIGIITFCAYFTPGGISPTVGMVLSVIWIIVFMLFGAFIAPDFMSDVLDRFKHYSEMYIFALFNPLSLPEGWWTTDTVTFFVGTTIAEVAVLTMCVIGMSRSS